MLEKFKQHLEQNFPSIQSFHPFFNEALKWMLEAGGKHFRAQLLLGIVNAKNPALFSKALNAALALEFIHTYSLIHDDLPAMDNASLRRGKQTLHKKYDETTAILVGDALNTQAFLLLSKLDLKENVRLKLIETLAFNAGLGGMIIGQAIDCYFE
ncbi:polyprenyl synthetase family protein, partial [Campylobacter lari]